MHPASQLISAIFESVFFFLINRSELDAPCIVDGLRSGVFVYYMSFGACTTQAADGLAI